MLSCATCPRSCGTMSRPAIKDAKTLFDGERQALAAFLEFVREHRDVYRIIDEAEFVDPHAYREHYETTATRIAARFAEARERGEISRDLTDEDLEILAWADMGANVFVGLRYAVWTSADPQRVAEVTNRILKKGLAG